MPPSVCDNGADPLDVSRSAAAGLNIPHRSGMTGGIRSERGSALGGILRERERSGRDSEREREREKERERDLWEGAGRSAGGRVGHCLSRH